MDKIVIHGGARLAGRVRISGSKNAALPVLIGTLLTDDECVIENVPALADIETTVRFLTWIGKRIERRGSRVTVRSAGSLRTTAPYDLVRKMRASALVMGPLLGRCGRVRVSLPGGCAIGARPIDIHLDSFKRLGARIQLSGGYVDARADRLAGARVPFRFPSVGATENVMLAAVLAAGTTVIENAAREPEIVDLAAALSTMGARISGAGTARITVRGVASLHGMRHQVIPDRIEAASFAIAAAATRGDVTLIAVEPEHIAGIIGLLRKAGARCTVGRDRVRVQGSPSIRAVSVRTAVYPGFPTDVQAQWMALMCRARGRCTVRETVFENRFLHVPELQRLGADLAIDDRTVTVRGVRALSGAPVMVSDLRAGAALVIAGLIADGRTDVLRIYHLDRGYEHLERKFRALGANIRRVQQ